MKSRITKIFFSLFIISFLSCLSNLLQANILPASEPIGISQTNIRNNKFAISWVTEPEEMGRVNYGTTSSLGQAAYDDRGQSVSGKTHHVTITSLSADTQYYYEIVSGGQTYNNGGQPYVITTGLVLGIPPSGSHVAYGQVFLAGGKPAIGAITTLKLQDGNGGDSSGSSQLLSVLVDINGWWSAELNSVRTQDFSDYFDFSESGDNLLISSRIDKNAPVSITVDTANDHPVPDITLGWVLNMQEMPWYQNQLPYYTGAATCQMILDYIREGANSPLLTQSDIYNYAHPAADNLDFTPGETDIALGHFDPYDSLVSNYYDRYDSSRGGNAFQGYNFSVDSYDSSAPNAINEYMRDICHWMAFTVTREEWWRRGALVERPNTPAAVPIFGNTQGYNHWVAVKGAATSNNPAPDPLGNPWNTPDFTIYGFWIKDPLVSGIGEDKYVTADECRNTYFKPLNTSDSYDGMYVQIAEPPAEMSTADVELNAPTSDARNIELVKIARGELKAIESAAPTMQAACLSEGPSAIGVKPKKKDLNWKNVVDPFLLTDEKAVTAFEDTYPHSPIFVRRLDKRGSDYYLIPYGKKAKYGNRIKISDYWLNYRYLTAGVVIIDAQKGHFKEASWTEEPTVYNIISEGRALYLVKLAIWNEIKENYMKIIQKCKQSYLRKRYEFILRQLQTAFWKSFNPRDAKTRLVWASGKYSFTPYKPFWEVIIGSRRWYVTQDEKVYKIN